MSFRITMLHKFNALFTDYKTKLNTKDVKQAMGTNSARVSPTLWELHASKLVSKTKKGNVVYWSRNKTGVETERRRQNEILSDNTFNDMLNASTKTPRAAIPAPQYSAQAVSAISGITELVENNAQMLNHMRRIHSELGGLIERYTVVKETPATPKTETETE